jgi:release factor glutamine methyltransferase
VSARKKILNLLHPVLKPLSQWYLSRTRSYRYQDIRLQIYPGVFHPGLFFSTKVLLNYLTSQSIQGSTVLELGAGSGLIAIYCARQGARVTASDINPVALKNITENASANNVDIEIVASDLFDNLNPFAFNWIIINPPYYPKNATKDSELAWYCGENFDYFEKLFTQLKPAFLDHQKIIMVLSEDCNIAKIKAIAASRYIVLRAIHQQQLSGERNYIFQLVNE